MDRRTVLEKVGALLDAGTAKDELLSALDDYLTDLIYDERAEAEDNAYYDALAGADM